ncbi:Hypothetical predicted protein [Olea europaea subsp. europaea]|uniref:Uncharacterized protein n=1 Tax=Olea europaea subsp. europaea TaxID=158383 RepID=A0A8S0TFD8_OLEEU|nr:Hypothetical predicted protein [Olea europaea subsp. europaea]
MLSQCPLPSFATMVSQALSHELFSRSIHGEVQQQSAFIASRGSSIISTGRNKHHSSSKMHSRNSSKSAAVTCHWCGKDNYTTKKCYKLGKLLKKAKDGGLIEAFSATSLADSHDIEWYTDTGATSHMTNDALNLDSSIPYNGFGNKSGDGSRPM